MKSRGVAVVALFCAFIVAWSGTPVASAQQGHHRVRAHVHLFLAQTTTHVGQPNRLTISVSARKFPVGKVRVLVDGKRVRTVSLHGRQATVGLPRRPAAGATEVRVRYLGSHRVRPQNASLNWHVIPTAPSVPLRVGTYNIVISSSTDTFQNAVGSMLDNVDILGLQEVNTKSKEKVMWGTFRDWSYVRDMIYVGGSNYPQHDYYYREDGAEQQPIMWRTSRFDFEGACKSLSSPEPLPGPNYLKADGISTYRPDVKHWVQVVRLRDRLSGQELSVINIHTLLGAVSNGHPRLGRQSHSWKLYTDQVRRLVHLAQAEKAAGRTVFVMGDFNDGYETDVNNGAPYGRALPVRAMRAIGMSSMWAIQRPTTYGTHNGSLLDHVFTSNYQSWVTSTTVYRGIKGSDHSPARGSFRVPIATPVRGDNTTRTPAEPPPVKDRDRNVAGPYKVTDNECPSDASY